MIEAVVSAGAATFCVFRVRNKAVLYPLQGYHKGSCMGAFRGHACPLLKGIRDPLQRVSDTLYQQYLIPFVAPVRDPFLPHAAFPFYNGLRPS